MRKTLGETIKHCNEVAGGALCEGTVNHKACVEEHKQLAEWLEELKRIREQPNRNVRKNVSGLEDDEPECPHCGDDLEKWDEYSYCPNCGQALTWFYDEKYEEEEEE